MKQIPLQGLSNYVLVDDDDFQWLNQLKWHVNEGYARTQDFVPGVRHYMHQLVIGSFSIQVDHINHNKLDNRKENLRQCTQQQNNANAQKRSGTSSKFKGVSFNKDKNKWEAKICVNYKTIHLGRHNVEEDAARAYNEAAREHFKEFAQLNEGI